MYVGETLEHFQQQVLTELKQLTQWLDRLKTKVEIGYKFNTDRKVFDRVVRLLSPSPPHLYLCSSQQSLYLW